MAFGGLFGGGGSTETVRHEWNPPADTSGSKIPGDDKMVRERAAAQKREEMAATKANKTLLGRSAGEAKMGNGKSASSSSGSKTTANYQ